MIHKSNQEAVEDVLASIREIIEHDVEQQTQDNNIINLKQHATARAVERLLTNNISDGSIIHEEDVFNLTEMLTETGEIIVLKEGETKMAKEKNLNEKNSEELETATVEEKIIETDDETEEIMELKTPASEETIKGSNASNTVYSEESLLSQQAAAETASAFSDLMTSGAVSQAPDIGSISVESLVQVTIRPILKEWLDANLPYLVKQIVTEEIQKMRRGK